MLIENSEEVLDIDIDDLFKDPEESQPQEETSNEDSSKEDVNLTEVMTKRINTVRRKTEDEVSERVAKEAGYTSYAEMKKAQEEKLVRDHGFNIDDIEKVIEPLLQKRLADDPRFKKLEDLEKREQENYINTQLNAINATTGQKLKISDLPQETIDLWRKGIDLEQAYYATHAKTLITTGTAKSTKGTLNHLAPGSNVGGAKTRGYSAEEKSMFSSILGLGGYSVTEAELAEKTIKNN